MFRQQLVALSLLLHSDVDLVESLGLGSAEGLYSEKDLTGIEVLVHRVSEFLKGVSSQQVDRAIFAERIRDELNRDF